MFENGPKRPMDLQVSNVRFAPQFGRSLSGSGSYKVTDPFPVISAASHGKREFGP